MIVQVVAALDVRRDAPAFGRQPRSERRRCRRDVSVTHTYKPARLAHAAPVVVLRAGCPFIFNDGVLRQDAEQRREERVAVLLRFVYSCCRALFVMQPLGFFSTQALEHDAGDCPAPLTRLYAIAAAPPRRPLSSHREPRAGSRFLDRSARRM